MTKWVILGANGMLGQEISNLLVDEDCVALNRSECDVTSLENLEDAVQTADIVVNCAAYTAVDDAESHEDKAFAINAIGAGNIAKICSKINAKLIHISTDYVFSGESRSPYSENSVTGPKTAYGRTKLAGEKAVQEIYSDGSYIVRTAWLYGQYGPNFVKTMIQLEKEKETISVVADQIGQPTWTFNLAEKLIELARTNARPGIYHGTSSGQTSWFGFTQKIFQLIGADPKRVIPVTSAEFIRPAPRPANSVLGHQALMNAGINPIRDWDDAITQAFDTGAFKA